MKQVLEYVRFLKLGCKFSTFWPFGLPQKYFKLLDPQPPNS